MKKKIVYQCNKCGYISHGYFGKCPNCNSWNTLEEKEEKVRDFRPIDDAFFETLADDIAFCQEILRVILNDKKLIVEDVIVQNSKRNLYGRSVRLDALCTLGDGTKCNIEVQRSNNDNHLKRVRFNAASISVVDSQKGEHFRKMEDLYVVYLSEFDVFHKGYTKYHVDSMIRETGEIVKDGLERIFVNTEIKDGTELSELMSCFLEKEVDNPKFPEFSKRMRFLKHEKGGLDAVCEVMERYEEIAAKKAAEKATKEASRKANINAVKNMIQFNISKDMILTKYSKEEYEQAVKELGEAQSENK